MRAGLVLLALLAGCELVPSTVASREDALEVVVVGSPGAGLGEIVSSCSTTALFGGHSEVRAEAFILTPVPSLTALSCTSGMNPTYVAGANPGGLGLQSAATWSFSGAAVNSLARNPVSGTLLVGREGDRVEAMTTVGQATWDAGTIALAWSPDGALFAAASSTKIDIFTWVEATALGTYRNSISLSVPPRHNALVFGEFLPNGTRDVAVGTVDGRVLVFNEFGGAPSVLTGDDLSFGTALAVEPGHLASLDALLVGEPGTSRVVRLFGDAGRGSWSGAAGDRFGAALAVLSNRRLLIGAPGADAGAGAIYSEALIGAGVMVGEAMVCDVSRLCSLARVGGCFSGACLGGVACIDQIPGCRDAGACLFDGAGYECVFPQSSTDAGSPSDGGAHDGGEQDGGQFDGGSSADAGAPSDAGDPTIDAGPGDAGMDDAGAADSGTAPGDGGARPIHFAATGCAAAPFALPALGLVLLARRRRR